MSFPQLSRRFVTASPLAALEQLLDSHTAPLSLEELSRVLGSLSLGLDDVAGHCHFNDRHYVRNLIRRSAHYELLCLCWRSGQRSRIHDHHQSNCAVRVLKGVMTNTEYELLPSGHIKAIGSADLTPGAVITQARSNIHQVGNLQPAGEELVTLHVYSPPLNYMKVFSIDAPMAGPRLRPVYFGLDGEGI
jgi:cysteine dioxygenase